MNRTKGGWQLAKLTLRKTEQTKPQIIRTPGIDRTIKIRLLRCKNGKRPNRELAEALLSAGRGCQIFLKFCSHAHLISSLKCATRTDICREGALHIQSLTWTSHITSSPLHSNLQNISNTYSVKLSWEIVTPCAHCTP